MGYMEIHLVGAYYKSGVNVVKPNNYCKSQKCTVTKYTSLLFCLDIVLPTNDLSQNHGRINRFFSF